MTLSFPVYIIKSCKRLNSHGSENSLTCRDRGLRSGRGRCRLEGRYPTSRPPPPATVSAPAWVSCRSHQPVAPPPHPSLSEHRIACLWSPNSHVLVVCKIKSIQSPPNRTHFIDLHYHHLHHHHCLDDQCVRQEGPSGTHLEVPLRL